MDEHLYDDDDDEDGMPEFSSLFCSPVIECLSSRREVAVGEVLSPQRHSQQCVYLTVLAYLCYDTCFLSIICYLSNRLEAIE